jgi:SAM-dependent methyltransferase
MLDLAHCLSTHERERAILGGLAARLRGRRLDELQLLEVGCGTGANLLGFLRMGFAPEKLCGLELLHERIVQAGRMLPSAVRLLEGDALQAPVAEGSQDIVFQSVVFSSLLDDAFQAALAARMWNWVRPGGAVLWYDFTYDNPRNPDVRGVGLQRIRGLFPGATLRYRRLTLAPPISRLLCRRVPWVYPLANAIPFLRTHVLCWLEKPAGEDLRNEA